MRCGLDNTRFLYARESNQGSTTALRELVDRLPDYNYKQIMRMDRRSFNFILNLIQNNPVFQNSARNNQAGWCMGSIDGYSRKIENIWKWYICWTIGANCWNRGWLVATVSLYTQRVFRAILSLRDIYIKWPDAEERIQISRRFQEKYGLPGATGILVGTHVHFEQRPAIDGEVFWTRKCKYSMNVQLICDDKKKIRYVYTGCPGSVHDSKVFVASHMHNNPELYFSAS